MAAKAKPESRLLQYLRTAPEDSIFGILGLDEQRRKKHAAEAKKRAEAEERTSRREEAVRAAAAAAAEAERRKAERRRLAMQRFVHGTLSKTLQMWVGLTDYKRHLHRNAAKVTAQRARREQLDAWEGWQARSSSANCAGTCIKGGKDKASEEQERQEQGALQEGQGLAPSASRVSPAPFPIIPPSIAIRPTTPLRRNLLAPMEDLGLAVMLRVTQGLYF